MFFTIKVNFFKPRKHKPAQIAPPPALMEVAQSDDDDKHLAIIPAGRSDSDSDPNPEFEVLEAIYNAQINPEVLNVHSDMFLHLNRTLRRATQKINQGASWGITRISIASSEESYGELIVTTPAPLRIANETPSSSERPIAITSGLIESAAAETPESVRFADAATTSPASSNGSTDDVSEAVIMARPAPLRRANGRTTSFLLLDEPSREDLFESMFGQRHTQMPLISGPSISFGSSMLSSDELYESLVVHTPTPLRFMDGTVRPLWSADSSRNDSPEASGPRRQPLAIMNDSMSSFGPMNGASMDSYESIAPRQPLRVVNGDASTVSTLEEELPSSFLSADTTHVASQSTTTPTSDPPVELTKDYDAVKKLGAGTFGTVYCVRNKATTKLSAVKIIPKQLTCEDGSTRPSLPLFVKEQEAAKIVGDHPYVIRLEASWHDKDNFYLMTPFYPGGDLGMHIKRFGRFTEERVRFYMGQLALAIEHLHDHKIIHRDIKPDNILLDAKGNAVLADVGVCHTFKHKLTVHVKDQDPDATLRVQQPYWLSSLKWKKGQQLSSSTLSSSENPGYDPSCMCYEAYGSEAYMAPEMLAGNGYSFNVDIWALGVSAFEMRCGRLPWQGNKDGSFCSADATYQVIHDPLEFEERDNVSFDFQSILNKMLTKKPHFRATIPELKNHRFLRNMNWKKLAQGKAKAPYVPAQCTSLPRNYRYIPLPLGDAFSPAEDPNPELNFRSPRLVDAAPLVASSSSDSMGGLNATAFRWIGRRLLAPKPKRKPAPQCVSHPWNTGAAPSPSRDLCDVTGPSAPVDATLAA